MLRGIQRSSCVPCDRACVCVPQFTTVLARYRKFGKVKREGGEEGEEDASNKRPKMNSLVGLPGTGETQEAVDVSIENPDGESGVPRPRRLLKIAVTRRDRKLMGTILGHLNKSKQVLLSTL